MHWLPLQLDSFHTISLVYFEKQQGREQRESTASTSVLVPTFVLGVLARTSFSDRLWYGSIRQNHQFLPKSLLVRTFYHSNRKQTKTLIEQEGKGNCLGIDQHFGSWLVAVDSKRFNVRVWLGPMMGNQNSAGKQTPRNVTPLLPCGLFTVEEKYPYEPDDYYRHSECCLAPPTPQNEWALAFKSHGMCFSFKTCLSVSLGKPQGLANSAHAS